MKAFFRYANPVGYSQKVPCKCEQCGKQFSIYPCRAKRGDGHYCSRECKHKGSKLSDAQLFWPYVEKTEECWLWTGSLAKGYGQAGRTRNGRRAHKLSWILHFGTIPDRLWVLHKCDNPRCVRPDHLFLGTAADNNADMIAKGRAKYGVIPPEKRYLITGRPKGTKLSPKALIAYRIKRGWV